MNNPRVVISCGTKFHSDHVGYQLQKYGILKKVITSHPPAKYLNRVKLRRQNITFLPPLFVIPYLLKKIPWVGNFLSRLVDYRLPPIFDFMASWFISDANVTITWSWAGLYTMRKMRAKNGITILEESGSCNAYQNELLEKEYETLGLKFTSRTPAYIVKREMIEATEADHILCPSNYVAESFIMKGIDRSKFTVIPYGVNLDNFKPLSKVNSTFTVLFVGTIGVRKGLIYLLKSLEILKNEIDIKCLLVGPVEDEFRPVLQEFSHLYIHLGKMSQIQLAKVYNQATVFVFPSLDEGMALVQLEAMACGLPIITTSNAGGESVIRDGIEGFIVPARSPEAIADKIRILSSNETLRASMAENAIKQANKFTWDAYGEKLNKFIQQL